MEVPMPAVLSRTVIAGVVLVRRLAERVRSAVTDQRGAALGDRGHAVRPVVLDSVAFSRLTARNVSLDAADIHEIDDAEERDQVIEVLSPRSRGFGTDVAELVAYSVRHKILRYRAPVTGLFIEPTTIGERRDGGFLVLVRVADTITLASDRLHPCPSPGAPVHQAAVVLGAVADAASHVYADYAALQDPR
jgi:hypothetical protein